MILRYFARKGKFIGISRPRPSRIAPSCSAFVVDSSNYVCAKPFGRTSTYRKNSSKSTNSAKDKSIMSLSMIGIPTGGLAGLCGALCGVGGGLVVMPVLKKLTNLSMHQITATSLCAVSVSTSVAALTYISQGYANLPIGILLSISSVVASKFGAKLNHQLPGKTLSKLLAVAMLLSVPLIFMKEDSVKHVVHTDFKTTEERIKENADTSGTGQQEYYWLGRTAPKSFADIPGWLKSHWEYPFIGFSVGFISALLGLGGGIITTTYMSLYSDLTQHEAVATSLIAMVPTGLSATYWHMKAGHVHFRAGGIIGAASALTMYIAASKIAPYCSEKQLRYAFGSLLLFSGFRMLL